MHLPPHPCHPSPYICWSTINEFHKKLLKTGENRQLSTCQGSCTKVSRSLSIIMLTEQGQYKGKTSVFKLNFQNVISHSTAKCKHGILLRHSHI